ncbi:hypothetical protein PAPHI01_0013 [Pancytospora philotis]|nr:hypothetical protein PAPHI01_0013 [Pancytospora philotis]
MRELEKYYGVKLGKRMSAARMLSRSSAFKAKQQAEQLLREVNALFASGFYDQCFALLKEVVRLIPNDPRPFYLLGLIHEEQRDYEKAGTGYLVCALLKKKDTALWRKVLAISAATADDKNQAIALEKIHRREPSRELLVRQLDVLRRLNKKYWIICCEIDLFEYDGVDTRIFERFRDTHHLTTVSRICKRLLSIIEKSEDARSEQFIRNTVYNLYKLKDWEEIIRLLNRFYFGVVERVAPEIYIINYIAKENADRRRLQARSKLISGELLSQCVAERSGGEAGSDNEDQLDDLGLSQLLGPGFDVSMGFLDISQLEEESYAVGESEGPSGVADAERESDDSPVAENEAPEYVCALDDFLLAGSFWAEIAELRYAYDLADHLHDRGQHERAIEILERLYAKTADVATKVRIGDFYHGAGNTRLALEYYRTALDDDPTSLGVRAKLHRLYMEMGEAELAAEYRASTEALEYLRAPGLDAKKNYRYSSDKCKEMRALHSEANAVLAAEYTAYPAAAKALLDDFFANVFVIAKHKNFRSFCNKYERVERDTTILPYDENLPKRKFAEKLVRISSLHGLDTEEWFGVVKNTASCLIRMGDYKAARRLLKKALSVHILRDLKYSTVLSFLALKVALHLKDFKTIVEITKNLVFSIDFSSSYLLYFMCSFFPGFFRYKSFNHFQKNMQRASKRQLHRLGATDLAMSPATAGMESGQGDTLRLADPFDAAGPFLVLTSYMPRYLFTETVDSLNGSIDAEQPSIATILGIINISHAKCRVVEDKMKYARTGMQLLSGISDEHVCKKYNLAKAYHFFGHYSSAERLYLEVVAGPDAELRAMSIYNLSLIFKKNKSKAMLMHLLSKIGPL